MAVPRRIRSSARARQIRRNRTIHHFCIALVVAVLVSAWSYRTAGDQVFAEAPTAFAQASAPVVDAAAVPVTSPTQPAPTATSLPTEAPTAAPTASPTTQPTAALPTLTPIAAEPTRDPANLPLALATPSQEAGQSPILYDSQAGDTLPAVAIRFGVQPGDIHSPSPLPDHGLLTPGQLLMIPEALGETTNEHLLLPDSEVVYSPTAIGFDVSKFVQDGGGYLSTYRQYMSDTGWTNGADVVTRVAMENSINPRLLLALLEYRAHWITGQPSNLAEQYYPINPNLDALHKELYYQLTWSVSQLQVGYYSWREGRLTSLTFPDGTTRRLAPTLNAGTVALQYMFSQMENEAGWNGDLYGADGFARVYEQLFGSPWVRDQSLGTLFPANVAQPQLSLPFVRGQLWSLTGGPHSAWIRDNNGGWAALDFAPASEQSGCVKSDTWAIAPAGGLVIRSANGVVMLDLDGDGHEQTGWVFMFLHVATQGRVPAGTFVDAGDLIGHPSCEGGEATGTHIHIARKFNGEWIAADGPMPFTLSGYVAHQGDKMYQGYLTKGDEKITACTCSSYETRVIRPMDDP
jgi:LysM repeat protein